MLNLDKSKLKGAANFTLLELSVKNISSLGERKDYLLTPEIHGYWL